jgi:dTDP-4-dehydrorhamnose 3,5-epimerase
VSQASGRTTGATATLPAGARLEPLVPFDDDRGRFLEIFRSEWSVGVEPVQWNAVQSNEGVLRGVHVHPRHDDYLVVAAGHAAVGLRDLRRDSETEGRACLVDMFGDRPARLTIPHGVAHGFYFYEPTLHIYAVSHYWDVRDELGCHWADPALEIPWPASTAEVSERDAHLPPLAEMLADLRSERSV